MTDTFRLIKYDAACHAIAEARCIDEVKQIRDISVAMRAYARQAGNRELEGNAIEIRMRATRRMDQMRQQQKATVGLARGGQPHQKNYKSTRLGKNPVAPTLTEVGIDKNLAHEGRKLGALSQADFEKAVTIAREAIGRVVKDALRTDDKMERRTEREQMLAAKICAMPERCYGVILADPPWRFEPYNRNTGMDRAADNHYPTMDTETIKQLAIPAADDCVLFLWATNPMLEHALAVLNAWDFTYKSNLCWGKDKAGTGFWSREKHELLLIGTRGNVPAPAYGEQVESLIIAARRAHSTKPVVFHAIIEGMFPNLPRIELFARNRFDGWDAWGNEA